MKTKECEEQMVVNIIDRFKYCILFANLAISKPSLVLFQEVECASCYQRCFGNNTFLNTNNSTPSRPNQQQQQHKMLMILEMHLFIVGIEEHENNRHKKKEEERGRTSSTSQGNNPMNHSSSPITIIIIITTTPITEIIRGQPPTQTWNWKL
ncbi:hypothetical protein ACTFIV_010917 [Dictyostelium citrinum]